ncbi:uncharacterized protein crybg2 [Mastacembelus armatus]|uniref:Crystallin beta-gamma domain containing 2 n=1 Tax=Mastacembelus armatus TaxID=205130 RepID=A0A3Q3L6Y6_9TELE|nr:uncharacterized protein LOC113126276 [Mastacembelus armatus]
MAKKGSSKKSLKSLFSRSDANPDQTLEKTVNKKEGEKKKFKLLKFKTKSKTSSGDQHSDNESQQVPSAVETNDTAVDGETWADSRVSDKKKFTLYGTAPRSKDKEFSYSELDLRKPKRFATFSFGLRKRKKKDEENISKSTFGLHNSDIEVPEETPLDLSEMKLDQPNTTRAFSMSQPELDTSSTFDIPSPSLVATKQSESGITLPKLSQSSVPAKTEERKKPLTNGSDPPDVNTEPPMASIPELQLDEEQLNTAIPENSSKRVSSSAHTPHKEAPSAIGTQIVPSRPASQSPVMFDSSDHKAALVNSFCTNNSLCDNDFPQQPYSKTVSLTEYTHVALSCSQPHAPNPISDIITNDASSSGDLPPVPHNDKSALKADSASTRQELSVSRTERFVPKTEKSASATSTVMEENSTHPVVQNEVYGALYESLFPQSFTSEVMASLSNPPPQTHARTMQLNTNSEPVMVKTTDECQNTETNLFCSGLMTSRDFTACKMDDAEHSYSNIQVKFSEKKVVSFSDSSKFTSYQSSTASELQTDPDVHHRYAPPSLSSASESVGQDIPYSELTRSHSGLKSDRFTLIHETIRSVPVVQNSAPPVSDYVRSHGMDTQVTDSKLRAVVIKELVTDETSSDPGCLSPALDKMSTVKGLEIKVKTENFSAPSGQRDEGLLSPVYLSVGSDDGSTTETYYSAEEDNAEESGDEEMCTVTEREDDYVVDGLKGLWLHNEQKRIVESGISRRNEADLNVAIVKTQNKGSQIGNVENRENNAEESEEEEMYTVNEREEICSRDGLKDVRLHEEQEKIKEKDISWRNEGDLRVVIVKRQSKESTFGNEENTENNAEESEEEEMYTVDEREETGLVDGLTEVQLCEEQQKTEEKELSKRNEGDLRVVIVKMLSKESKWGNEETTENNAEESEEEEMSTVDEREEIGLAHGLREGRLCEEQEELEERDLCKRNEGDLSVETVKIQNEESKMGNEGNTEELHSQSELKQLLGGQRAEADVHKTGRSDFLVSSDAESVEKEIATTALPQAREEMEGRKEELLATPVQRVMVCKDVPPSSEPHGQGEESGGNQTKDLETEDHLYGGKQLSSQELQCRSYKDIMTSEYIHSASSKTIETNLITPTYSEAEEQVSAKANKNKEVSKECIETNSKSTTNVVALASGRLDVVMGTLAHRADQSDATEIKDSAAPQRSEWVDTLTQSTDRNSTLQEEVAVKLSASNVDVHHPDTKAAEALTDTHKLPPEARLDLTQGSLAPSASSEIQQTKVEQELVDKMNSGYRSLSTKLSIKSLSPIKEDESKHRFRKVSLISEAGTTTANHDTVDFSNTVSNGTDLTTEHRWKNRLDGAAQYKPSKPENAFFSDSLSYIGSDTYSTTSSSTFPEAPAYKYQSTSFFSSSSSPLLEEHLTLGNRLSDSSTVYLSRERESTGEPTDEWRRSLVEQEESAAPAAQRHGQREGEAESDPKQLSVSGFSSTLQTSYTDSFTADDDEATRFTGVFKATFVELVPDSPAPVSSPLPSPDADSSNQFEMDMLVDTLKSMGPSLRPRSLGPRALPQVLVSSLPPIVEDAPSPVASNITAPPATPTKKVEATTTPADSLDGLYTLPHGLGLKSSNRDTRSPLEMMKQSQQAQQPETGTRGLNLPLRASVTNSILTRKSSDSPTEDLKSPVLNGNGVLPSFSTGSRLDNSVIFGSYRSSSIDLETGKAHRPIFRASSLPELWPSNDRMSAAQKEPSEPVTGTGSTGSRFERMSLLLSSSSSSLTGTEDPNTHMSRPPPFSITSPPSTNSPTRLQSPTSSIDLHRHLTTTDSPLSMFGQMQEMGVGMGKLSTPTLQRSFSSEGTVGFQQTSLFSSVHGGSQFQSQEPEPERNLSKYRAFPDAYLTKQKEHGKLNPRPGKMYIFDRPGMCGQRFELRGDVIDATPWELQETISIRVIRGGWVLYEKPNFKGEKIALDEGDIELTYPFTPPEEQLQNVQKDGEGQNGELSEEATDGQAETKPARRFIIGSIRRAVRDYSVPEICLFPEENAEGKKVIFRDTSEDARIFGFPVKANSIIINAGLWLVYAKPFFQGVPRVLEVGGFSNPAAWGVEQPYVGSLHPLKIGEPRVENMTEPKLVIYEKQYFTGKSRTITTNMRDFITRSDKQQNVFMYSVGSLKVLGGVWVGYEKEGFRGHQYLLEEGEYHDWRVWGGCSAELRSIRVIRADLTDPLMVMFEQPEEEQEPMPEENTFEVTEAIPDVETFGYKTSTRSIHVLSGAWVAYSHVDFSGNQYILEKGFYNNFADWGSQDTRICSVQPILLAPGDSSRTKNEILLYSDPDFQGECQVFDHNQEALSEKLLINSCRVVGGSWVLYENKEYSGNLYVLSEGDYPNLTSMGCLPGCTIRSVKVIPLAFSVPSISLFGLECMEGREVTTDTEILNIVEEGFNNHILSIRVSSGRWVICEHSNYRGRQFLLEPTEITNWPKFSSLNTIGSIYPIRQKRHFFRIKNKERGHFMSVQGGVEELKSGRVVVTPEVEPMSDIWFYQDGFIKNKLSQTMSLQVMGNIEPAAKVVLWTETRQPIQTWASEMSGLITSLTFPDMVLDVKGGKSYDKDHVVIMPKSEERPSQQWQIELL